MRVHKTTVMHSKQGWRETNHEDTQSDYRDRDVEKAEGRLDGQVCLGVLLVIKRGVKLVPLN